MYTLCARNRELGCVHMPKYSIPVWKMVKEVSTELPKDFAPIDVISRVRQKYGSHIKKNTIRCQVIGLTPNHPSSKHYPTPHKLFHRLGRGRYRLLKPEEGGELMIKRPSVEETERKLESEEEAIRFSFEFEEDLEHHLVNNLDDIEKGLKLYTEDGKKGEQYITDVGRIDILAVDENGDIVVIELKRCQAKDKSFAQLSRYLGWVKRHLAKKQKVRGVIIAREITDELKYAASTSESVKLMEYEVHFNFHDVDLC